MNDNTTLSTGDEYWIRESELNCSQWVEIGMGDNFQGRYAVAALKKEDLKQFIHELIVIESRMK